jgi:hypothetical protein
MRSATRRIGAARRMPGAIEPKDLEPLGSERSADVGVDLLLEQQPSCLRSSDR